MGILYCVGKRKATHIVIHLAYMHNYSFAHMMIGRPVLGVLFLLTTSQ